MIRTDTQRERHKEANRKWYHSHRTQILTVNREWRDKIKLETLCRYSNTNPPSCVVCGVTDVDVLCIDHLNGGGNEHRRKLDMIAGIKFYYWLRNQGYPDGYQVLCANCNLKKSIEARRNGRYL